MNIRQVAGDTVLSDDPHPKIGTLGLNFFRERVLLLDFPAERFAILDSNVKIPRRIEERARWVDADYSNDKIFIPLTLAGATHDDFFYDSGASLFPVSTTRAIWQQATRRSGNEPGNTVVTVPSFGQAATFIGAPALGRVAVGEAALERPMIYYLAEGPDALHLENWDFPTSGLIGNVLFADQYLVIIDLPRRRFGLVARQVP